MRRIWMLCALMLSLTASASTAEALTHRSVSRRARWVGRHHPQGKRKTPHKANAQPAAVARTSDSERPVLFGDQNLATGLDFNPAGWAEAFPFTNTTSGAAESIAVYVDSQNHARTLITGVYSDRNGAQAPSWPREPRRRRPPGLGKRNHPVNGGHVPGASTGWRCSASTATLSSVTPRMASAVARVPPRVP